MTNSAQVVAKYTEGGAEWRTSLAHGPMSALRDRPWLGGLLAFVFRPLSFLGADAAGAITLARPVVPHLLALGLAVGAAFFAACTACRRGLPARHEA